MVSRLPLIVVLGATGVGKSKLGIELAKRFNGEVISADSMQVYKGLDIITNKVTQEEAEGIPHHMMGFLDPLAKYTVVDYRDAALPIIENLIKEGKAPIVVGGTNYYIESLLWENLVEKPSERPAGKDLVWNKPRIASPPLGPSAKARVEARMAVQVMDIFNEELAKLRRIHRNNSQSKKLSCLESGKLVEEVEEKNRALEAGTRGLAGKLAAEGGTPEAVADRLDSFDDKEAAEVLTEVADWCGGAEKTLLGLCPSKSALLQTLRLHNVLKILDPRMASSLHPNDRRKIIRSLEVLSQKGKPHSEVLEEQRSLQGGSSLGGPLRFTSSLILWLQCDTEVLNVRLDNRVDDMIKRGLLQELLDFHEKYNSNRINNSGGQLAEAYTEGIFQSIGFKEFHDYLVLGQGEREGEKGAKMLKEGVDALKLATGRYAKRQSKWIRNRIINPPGRMVPPVVRLDTSDPAAWESQVLEPACQAVSDPPPPTLTPVRAIKPRTTFHCHACRKILLGDKQWEAHRNSKKHKFFTLKKEEKQQAPS